MKLHFKTQIEALKSQEIADSLVWTNSELFFLADNQIKTYNPASNSVNKFIDLLGPTNDIDCLATSKGGNDGFALGMADGTLVIVQRTGKIQKKTPNAHKDSIICVKWSYDGSSLATSGEDGLLKIWSKNGSFRNNLVQGDRSIYSLCWSPQNDSILFCSQKSITLKPIQPSKKSISWKAHEGIVLKLDWNPSSNLIVSTGEDCRYKIWDSYGRQLFCSAPYDYVLTSATWAPCGNYLAVGGYGMVRLCDKTGWTYSYHKLAAGSPLKLCWSADSTQLAGACGSGDIIYGAVLDRSYFFQSWECRIVEQQKLIVKDLLNEAQQDLTFKDRIVNLNIGYNQLVVTTSRQCYIYSFSNWNTPHIFDLKDAVSLILLSPKTFCLLNITNGPTIYNYDGKLISNIKVAGKFQFLSNKKIALSNETLAVVDINPKIIRFFQTLTGKQSNFFIEHTNQIQEIDLNQVQNSAQRKIVFADSNKDLCICPVTKKDIVKLSTICDSFKWHNKFDILTATSDQKFIVWYNPNSVYLDKDISDLCKIVKQVPEIGRMSQIVSFSSSLVNIRRKDGSIVTQATSPHTNILFQFCEKMKWEKAIKLCRYVKQPSLWACLAAISLHAKQLNSAEMSLAAIQMVDKVQYINYVKQLPSEITKQAAMCLFFKKNQEAQQILIQAKLFYRAIKLNVKLYHWERALELAQGFKKHVDTVVAYRNRYLQQIGKQQTMEKFLKAREEVGEISWQKIKAEIKAEKDKQKKMK